MSKAFLCQDCPSGLRLPSILHCASLAYLLVLSLDPRLAYHLSLLNLETPDERNEETSLAPVFTGQVLNQRELGQTSQPLHHISQYGLLGGVRQFNTPNIPALREDDVSAKDPRLFFNVASPSSTFICGSQGSGKSHTLSCILEGCLIISKAGRLLKPLTAVVFHYDSFICDNGGSPCEAAFLASHANIKVRVLCAPTNMATIRVICRTPTSALFRDLTRLKREHTRDSTLRLNHCR